MPEKVITIAQQKGGAGKTTIAANLASGFAKEDKKVIVVDTDPQSSLTKWLNIRKLKLGKEGSLQGVTVQGWRIFDEIKKLGKDNDVIIIDSPPQSEADTKAVIKVADLVIVPMQPGATDMWVTEDTIELIEALRVPYRVLFNRFNNNSSYDFDLFARFNNTLTTKITNRNAFVKSFVEGLSVVDKAFDENAASEIKSLVKEVSELLFAYQSHFGDDKAKEICDVVRLAG